MHVIIKWISLFLLSSIAYSKIITNHISISYLVGNNTYAYQQDSNITILDKDENGDALSITKVAQKKYEDNSSLEIEFTVTVNINREISELIIGDEIADDLTYVEGSLRLNGVAPESFLLLDSALSIFIGEVKAGEVYRLVYSASKSNI
jgi:uncharacterized surface anchored protein